MSEHDIELRYPELDFSKNSPLLGRVNGIGCALYGRRDVDRENGSYVKWHCFCVLWIPLLPIASYRVVDADGGWYILGRLPFHPVEKFVRMTALAVMAGAALAAMWGLFTSTDWYRNRETWSNVDSIACLL